MPDAKKRAERFDLRAIYETSCLLSSSLDLEFVLVNLLLTAMSKLLVTRGLALLYDPVEGGYRAAAVRGLSTIAKGEWIRLESAPQDMLQGGEVPEALARNHVRLVLPVQSGHRNIGIIGLGRKATGAPFEDQELEFVQSLVNISAAAVHNSLIVEELKQANRDLDGKVQQLHTLFDLSQEFNATVERDRLIRLFSFALMGQMLIGRYVFFLRRRSAENDAFHIVSMQGIPDAAFKPEFMEALRDLDVLVTLEGAPEIAEVWPAMHRRGLVLAVPLKQHGETHGVLCLGPKLTGQAYLPDEVEFLIALGNLAVISIQNVELIEERIEKERMEEEMRMAREIQRGLLPRAIPEIRGLQVAALALPSREVGGDYFDVLPLPDGRLFTIIADVTGKGIPAALLMSSIQACTHTLVPMSIPLTRLMAHINRVICQNTSPDKFITAFAAVYHADSRRLEYVNAGHEPPLVVRKEGDIVELEEGGLLLGVLSMATYECGSIELAPGDTVVLFTDGVTEAMGQKEEEYTDARLRTLLAARHTGTAQEVLEHIQADVESFTGPVTVLSDDRTMIVVKVTEGDRQQDAQVV